MPFTTLFATVMSNMAKVISKNPATGEVLAELEATPSDSISGIYKKARESQRAWASVPLKQRAAQLLNLRESLLNEADSLASLISLENGKPAFEAIANEILPSVDMLSYFAKRAPQSLRDQPIPLRLMKHRKSTLTFAPLGVILVISPWNYPFLLPFAPIFMAVAAGNSVIFKPSEITPQIGLRIQKLFEISGFPQGLVQTVIGDGSLGAQLIDGKPNKIFFTGSTLTGKKIMAAAAEHLIPVNLELGGKDPMIVLPDANLDFATSAALWGGFSNAGQVCASTERLILHENIAAPFLALLKEKMSRLRQGPSISGATDLGPITMEKQRLTYASQLAEAKQQGAAILSGGEFSENSRFLQPTLVTGERIEDLQIYKEETFGPVLASTTFQSTDEAVEKANASPYGLTASIMTRNTSLGEQMARKLQYGTVMINEVTYTAGLGETPWGGFKDSGFGRTHSDFGLHEFVQIRHVHKPRSSLFVFKSLWWFPYTPYQLNTFRHFIDLYRKSWTQKLRAFSHTLWNFVQFIKSEPRL